MKTSIKLPDIFIALFLVSGSALAQDHPSIKYPTSPPPSAQLHYQIKADHSSITFPGEANVVWQTNWTASESVPNPTYSITTETRAILVGKILQANSKGVIDSFGLAPSQYEEKPRNKSPALTTFNLDTKLISFSESSKTYPLKGGEQDRTSAVWQLVSIARAVPNKFIPKSQWTFFVAGRRDAEKWTFTVKDNAVLSTPFGYIATVHITKAPPPDSKGQTVDIWLAPNMEWYPVRLRFSDADGNIVDQRLDRIDNKLLSKP